MEASETLDLLVVGGGPAGLAVAIAAQLVDAYERSKAWFQQHL